MKKKVIIYIIVAITVLLLLIIFFYQKNTNKYKVEKFEPIDRSLINREHVKSSSGKGTWTWENK